MAALGRHSPLRRGGSSRSLRFEPLEDRTLLSVAGWPGTVIHDASGNLFTVDVDGGMALQYVGNMNVDPGAEMFDMAFSPQGVLYGVNNPGWGFSELYEFQVDFESPTPEIVIVHSDTITMGQGQGIEVNSLQFNKAGEMFAAGLDADEESWLFKVNPDTAGATRVLELADDQYIYESAGDLAFDIDGNLYLTTFSGHLLRIPPEMDSFEVVGQTQYDDFFGLISGPAPLTYGFRAAKEVHRIDPATGEATLVAQLIDPQLDFVYGAATVFWPPTDLGEVDFRHLTNQKPTLGELWYRFEPARQAVLTIDVPNVDPAAEIDVTLYQLNPQGELVELQTGQLRLDYENPVAGAEYFVKIDGAESNVDVRVTNLVRPVGNGAIVYGTDKNDTFGFVPGPPYTMMINGVSYSYNFNSNSIVTVTFAGGIGHDVAELTGSRLDDVATLSLASFSGTVERSPRYRVQVTGTPEIKFDGAGGNDSAVLTGSGFGDQITLQPKSATVVGMNSLLRATNVATISVDAVGGADTATFTGNSGTKTVALRYRGADFGGTGFSTSLANTETITAISGGSDTVQFSDSPQPDTFEVTPGWASLTGPGFSLMATGFQQIRGESSHGGYDSAILRGDPGAQDRFEATPQYGKLTRTGFQSEAVSFRYVDVFGTRASGDVALLYGDPAGQDSFEAWPLEARLEGNGFRQRVYSFRYVHAFANAGGTDAAVLHDDPGAQDRLKAKPEQAELYSSEYYIRAKSFRSVHAQATAGGNDVALLYDNPAGLDNFEAWPDHAQFDGDGFSNRADSFRTVLALATPGFDDAAVLHDDPGGRDVFKAWPEEARLYSDEYYVRTKSFRSVHAQATPGGNDVALLYDNPGALDTFEAWPDDASLHGAMFSNRAESFRSVIAMATPGFDDVAVLHDEPGGQDRLKAWPDEARLYSDEYYLRARSFRYVHAHATPGQDDVALLYDNPIGVDTFEAWPDEAWLEGGTYSNHVYAFRYVHALATPGQDDVAEFHGNAGGQDLFEAWPDQARLSGAGYYNRAKAFRYVYASGTKFDGDRAILHDAALTTDYLDVADNWAKLYDAAVSFFYEASDFDTVTAISSTPSGDIKNVAAHDFTLNLLGFWQDGP